MAASFTLLSDNKPIGDDIAGAFLALEAEENADLPGAIQLRLPLRATDKGDLTFVGDARLRPLANLSLVAQAGGGPECIFDGYILSHRLHLETGTTDSSLEIWGQDATCLMNREEKTREWVNVTDAAAAATIFGGYEIASSPENNEEDSAAHVESGRSLMQRATDAAFLRNLARRTGKLFRVACGSAPGVRIGYFARPNLTGTPAATLRLNDLAGANTDALDIEWDVARPTTVKARQALFTDAAKDGAAGDAQSSDLDRLGDHDLKSFAGKEATALLTAPVDDAGELKMRSRALLRESEWFVRCQGEADAGRLKTILRVGQIVAVEGIGAVHSGKYFVWSVRHRITADSHKMRYTLLRNAVGG